MSDIKHSTPHISNLSENQLQYIRILSPQQHQYVVDAWQALVNRKTNSHDLDENDASRPIPRPYQEDMGLACDKCYDAIRQNRVIESQIGHTIDQIIHRIYDFPYHNEVEDIRDAVEQMIRLASRMIKGTPPCVLASEARCHNQGSADIHRKFVDGIQKVVDAGMDLELDWELSTNTRLSKIFTEDKTMRGVKEFRSSWKKCGVMEVVIVGTETVSLAETVHTWIDIISTVR
jgi:hypothetical protein